MSNNAALHLQRGPSVVQLNVGGVVFQTSRETLLKAEAAGLRELLVSAEDGSLRFDCSGHLFLDSNPRTFEVVLDFLRDGAAALPSSQFELQKLWIDARKFRVSALEAQVLAALRPLDPNPAPYRPHMLQSAQQQQQQQQQQHQQQQQQQQALLQSPVSGSYTAPSNMAAMATGQGGGMASPAASIKPQPQQTPNSAAHAQESAVETSAATAYPSSSKRRRPYFDHAKRDWEEDDVFKLPVPLPDGSTHWPQVEPGNPEAADKGRVVCRLCRYFGIQNPFTLNDGYSTGKKSGLVQHQVRSRDHLECLELLVRQASQRQPLAQQAQQQQQQQPGQQATPMLCTPQRAAGPVGAAAQPTPNTPMPALGNKRLHAPAQAAQPGSVAAGALGRAQQAAAAAARYLPAHSSVPGASVGAPGTQGSAPAPLAVTSAAMLGPHGFQLEGTATVRTDGSSAAASALAAQGRGGLAGGEEPLSPPSVGAAGPASPKQARSASLLADAESPARGKPAKAARRDDGCGPAGAAADAAAGGASQQRAPSNGQQQQQQLLHPLGSGSMGVTPMQWVGESQTPTVPAPGVHRQLSFSGPGQAPPSPSVQQPLAFAAPPPPQGLRSPSLPPQLSTTPPPPPFSMQQPARPQFRPDGSLPQHQHQQQSRATQTPSLQQLQQLPHASQAQASLATLQPGQQQAQQVAAAGQQRVVGLQPPAPFSPSVRPQLPVMPPHVQGGMLPSAAMQAQQAQGAARAAALAQQAQQAALKAQQAQQAAFQAHQAHQAALQAHQAQRVGQPQQPQATASQVQQAQAAVLQAQHTQHAQQVQQAGLQAQAAALQAQQAHQAALQQAHQAVLQAHAQQAALRAQQAQQGAYAGEQQPAQPPSSLPMQHQAGLQQPALPPSSLPMQQLPALLPSSSLPMQQPPALLPSSSLPMQQPPALSAAAPSPFGSQAPLPAQLPGMGQQQQQQQVAFSAQQAQQQAQQQGQQQESQPCGGQAQSAPQLPFTSQPPPSLPPAEQMQQQLGFDAAQAAHQLTWVGGQVAPPAPQQQQQQQGQSPFAVATSVPPPSPAIAVLHRQLSLGSIPALQAPAATVSGRPAGLPRCLSFPHYPPGPHQLALQPQPQQPQQQQQQVGQAALQPSHPLSKASLSECLDTLFGSGASEQGQPQQGLAAASGQEPPALLPRAAAAAAAAGAAAVPQRQPSPAPPPLEELASRCFVESLLASSTQNSPLVAPAALAASRQPSPALQQQLQLQQRGPSPAPQPAAAPPPPLLPPQQQQLPSPQQQQPEQQLYAGAGDTAAVPGMRTSVPSSSAAGTAQHPMFQHQPLAPGSGSGAGGGSQPSGDLPLDEHLLQSPTASLLGSLLGHSPPRGGALTALPPAGGGGGADGSGGSGSALGSGTEGTGGGGEEAHCASLLDLIQQSSLGASLPLLSDLDDMQLPDCADDCCSPAPA